MKGSSTCYPRHVRNSMACLGRTLHPAHTAGCTRPAHHRQPSPGCEPSHVLTPPPPPPPPHRRTHKRPKPPHAYTFTPSPSRGHSGVLASQELESTREAYPGPKACACVLGGGAGGLASCPCTGMHHRGRAWDALPDAHAAGQRATEPLRAPHRLPAAWPRPAKVAERAGRGWARSPPRQRHMRPHARGPPLARCCELRGTRLVAAGDLARVPWRSSSGGESREGAAAVAQLRLALLLARAAAGAAAATALCSFSAGTGPR